MAKERVTLDISDISSFAPKPKTTVADKKVIERAAEDAGFNTRHAKQTSTKAARIDGRTLRRKNKDAQLNIAVTEATRNRFWTLAQDHDLTSGEDMLIQLLDAFEASYKGR